MSTVLKHRSGGVAESMRPEMSADVAQHSAAAALIFLVLE